MIGAIIETKVVVGNQDITIGSWGHMFHASYFQLLHQWPCIVRPEGGMFLNYNWTRMNSIHTFSAQLYQQYWRYRISCKMANNSCAMKVPHIGNQHESNHLSQTSNGITYGCTPTFWVSPQKLNPPQILQLKMQIRDWIFPLLWLAVTPFMLISSWTNQSNSWNSVPNSIVPSQQKTRNPQR